jgi:hypothetical protein
MSYCIHGNCCQSNQKQSMRTVSSQRNRVNRESGFIIATVALTVVLLVVFSVLFPSLASLNTQRWQQATSSGILLPLIVLISLCLTFLPRQRRALTQLLTSLVITLCTLSCYFASITTLYDQQNWLLAASPWLFTLCTFILTMPRWLSPLQRLAGTGAALLFYALIYLAAITHLWWQLILICLSTYLTLLLLQRIFIIRRRYMRIQFQRNSCLVTLLVVLVCIYIGLPPSVQLSPQFSLGAMQPVFNATIAVSIIALLLSARLTLRQCVLLWGGIACIIVLLTLLLSQPSPWTIVLTALTMFTALTAGGISFIQRGNP